MARATTRYVGPDAPALVMPDGHRLALRDMNAKQRKAAIKRYPQVAKYWVIDDSSKKDSE